LHRLLSAQALWLHQVIASGLQFLSQQQKKTAHQWWTVFLVVAGEGFEPTTDRLSLRAALRYPENASGLRFPCIFRPLRKSGLHFIRRRRREALIPNEPRSSDS